MEFELFMDGQKILTGKSLNMEELKNTDRIIGNYKSPKCVKLTTKYAEKLSSTTVNLEYSGEHGYLGMFTGIPVEIDDTIEDFEFIYE